MKNVYMLDETTIDHPMVKNFMITSILMKKEISPEENEYIMELGLPSKTVDPNKKPPIRFLFFSKKLQEVFEVERFELISFGETHYIIHSLRGETKTIFPFTSIETAEKLFETIEQ